jgi:perosamine synthetase
MKTQIRILRKENLAKIMPGLLSLENNWTGIGEQAWTKENFERDLPGKWELSAYAMHAGKIAGYAICSAEKGVGKLNKIVVGAHFRNLGIASSLWSVFLQRCRAKGLSKAEFKVLPENTAAISFYIKHGVLFHGSSLGADKKVRVLNKYVFRTERDISHSKPTIDSSDIKAVSNALQNGDIATGNIVEKFNSALSRFIGKKFAIATNSGSNALHLALRALNVKRGDEVIIPSYICSSVMNSVMQCGAKPVLVDINKDDYNISFEDSRKKISKKTKAIILPHMFGQPVKDIEKLLKLKVPVIEDCAQAIGSEHNGKKVGQFGLISIFSFYATKVMTSGVGGAVLTDNEKIMNRLKSLTKNDGRETFGENYSYRMSDVQAALALNQLKKLGGFVKRRKAIARKYSELFRMNKIDFKLPELEESIFYRYVVRHDEGAALIRNLKARGAYAEKPVFRCLHSYLGIPNSRFPNSSEAFEKAVSIPIYPSLTDSEVEDVASILVNWKNEAKK